jgi:hypothetical protein
MTSDELRVKIRKLFDMANMGEGNEAEVALKKAYELLEAHEMAEKDVKITQMAVAAPARKKRWQVSFAKLCGDSSGALSLDKWKGFIFAGDETGACVACELYEYLKNEINRQVKKRKIKNVKLRDGFRLGCVKTLCARFRELGGWRDMEKRADEIREKYFSDIRTKQAKTVKVNGIYFMAGMGCGNEINISRQAGVENRVGYLN